MPRPAHCSPSRPPIPTADPTTRQALASREQELRTLLELSQAFGRDLDRDAILARLGFALSGQLFVGRRWRCCAAGAACGRVAARGRPPDVPEALADLAARPLADGPLARDAGFAVAVPLRAGDVSRGVVLLGAPRLGRHARRARLRLRGRARRARRGRARDGRPRRRAHRRARRGRRRPRRCGSPGPSSRACCHARSRPSRASTWPCGGGPAAPSRATPTTRRAARRAARRRRRGRRGQGPPGRAADVDRPGRPAPAAPRRRRRRARPHDATARLDRLVADSTEAHQFATLAWAVVDPA